MKISYLRKKLYKCCEKIVFVEIKLAFAATNWSWTLLQEADAREWSMNSLTREILEGENTQKHLWRWTSGNIETHLFILCML